MFNLAIKRSAHSPSQCVFSTYVKTIRRIQSWPFLTCFVPHLTPTPTANPPSLQPVQGFDYAKQHLGQQGGDDEASSAGGDTLALALPLRDAPLTLDKTLHQEGSRSRKTLTSGLRKR